jgi:O-antigen/teichoic acid export membrane protein
MRLANFKNTTQRFGLLTLVQLLTVLFPVGMYILLINRVSLEQIGQITTWQMIFVMLAGMSNFGFPQNLIPFAEKLKTSSRTTAAYWNKLLQIRSVLILFFFLLLLSFASYLPAIALFSSLLLLARLYNPTSFFYVLSQNNALLWFHFYTKLAALAFVFFFITEHNWYVTNFWIALAEILISIPFLIHKKWAFVCTFSKVKKVMVFVKSQKKLFYLQIVNTLILSATIPFVQLCFGAQIAGVSAVLEKATSLIRGVSGNLFYAILPNFKDTNQLGLSKNMRNGLYKITYFTLVLFCVAVGLIVSFEGIITQKFQEIPMMYYLLLVQIIWFPVMLSTSFQIICMKKERWNTVYLFSKIQLAVLVIGLMLLGNLFGVWGIVCAIILPELVNFLLYKNAVKK